MTHKSEWRGLTAERDKLSGQVAVMREALKSVGGCNLAGSHNMPCAYVPYLETVLATGAGKAQAAVIAAAREFAEGCDQRGCPEDTCSGCRAEPLCGEVERMGAADARP